MSEPLRPGDVWLVNLNPVVGSEQAGRRPVIIVSGPLHLSLPHAVVFVVPMSAWNVASEPSRPPNWPPRAGYSGYSLTCSRLRRGSDHSARGRSNGPFDMSGFVFLGSCFYLF
jgi:hypothetical protein